MMTGKAERIPRADLRILLVEVTQRCNAACDHCGSRCSIDSPEVLTKEEILKVFRDIRDQIGTDVMLNITGGEPLIRRDLFEIMTEASRMGFDWGMVSNGTLITDKVIEQMKRSGMRTITVSIDGVGETHEKLRHLPGSYRRILGNLQKLKDADFLDCLQVTFTSNKQNVRELPQLYADLEAIGIDSIRTSCIDPIGRAEDHPELILDREDYEFLFSFINRVNGTPGKMPIEWGCCHYLGDRLPGRQFFCFAGIYSASILYNGDIFVCPNVPRRPELIQGNIRTDSFPEVWKKGFRYYRERKIPAYCKGCHYAGECRGDSVHNYDFDRRQPKFCYRKIFDVQTPQYEQYLQGKYGTCRRICIDAPGNADTIYIEPEAYRELAAYFHVGARHPLSLYEQQMGLVGFKVDHDYVVKYVFPSVTRVIAADLATFTKDTVPQAVRTTKVIRANFAISDDRLDYVGDGLRFLGFIHSHPVQEDLCYSVGDEVLHRQLYSQFGDYIGLLINPEKDLIGAYYGSQIRQANLVILEPEEHLMK